MTNHILLVEDDTNMREVIAFFLDQEGYHVTQASDGKTALDLLNHPASPDLSYDVVLSDIVMGDIDGIHVMHAARSLPDPPEVILLTGQGSLETAISAVRSGAFDYLLKPCDLDTLLERIVAATRHRQEWLHHARNASIGRRFAQFVSQLNEQGQDYTIESAPTTTDPPPLFSPTVPAQPPSMPQPASDSQPSASADQSSQPTEPGDRYLVIGKLTIDTYRHEIFFDSQPIHVTPNEFQVLACLASMPGRVVTFSELVRSSRNYEVEKTEARDLIRGNIRSLRSKFDRRYIVSVRGVGFMLADPDENA